MSNIKPNSNIFKMLLRNANYLKQYETEKLHLFTFIISKTKT
jgi:hypothetical protein